MRLRRRWMAALATVVLLSVVLAACGTDSDSPATSQDSPGEVASSDASTGKVSANNASEEELLAAFEEAGIPNAKQWSHEVEEYRPYPVDDPSFQKLRAELQKYNPGPGVLDAILALLELP